MNLVRVCLLRPVGGSGMLLCVTYRLTTHHVNHIQYKKNARDSPAKGSIKYRTELKSVYFV
jgi:hypothetical protein